MSQLVVLAFDQVDTAEKASKVLADLEQGQVKDLTDVVIVVRHGDGRPQIKQLKRYTGEKALGGTFWGMLIGLIFFVPVAGAIIGAIAGTAFAFLRDSGIPDVFIREVADTVTPGTSALFILSKTDPGQIVLRLKEFNGKLIQTTMADSDVEHLKVMNAVD